MVHRREEYLSGSTILCLTGPLKESALRPLTTALQITVPAVFVQPGVDGTDTHLRAEAGGDLVDQFRPADGGRVHAHLVGAGIEQPLNVGQLVDATAYRERNVQRLSHASHHLGKSLPAFERCGDIEEYQFVGTLLGISFAQLHRVACRTEVHEIGAFDGLTVLHV